MIRMTDTPPLKTALKNKDQHIGPPETHGKATKDEECGVDEWLSGDFEVCDIHG